MLTIIDGNNLLFRAYYGIKNSLTRRDGTPVGAVYGFCTMILNLLATAKDGDSFAVAFDAGRVNFRHEIYPDYKGNRSPTPPELLAQMPLARAAADAMGVLVLETPGFEADDIIATLARRRCQADGHTRIVTSDKDLMQLISNCCTLYDGLKGKDINAADAMEKFGVKPELILDVQAITGDSVDNIPGIPGLGPKAAAKLVNEFGSLDGIYQNLDKVSSARIKQLLIDNKALAYMSRRLADLNDQVPLPADAARAPWAADTEKMATFFDVEMNSPSLVLRAKKLVKNEEAKSKIEEVIESNAPVNSSITTATELNAFLKKIKDVVAIYITDTGGNYMDARIANIDLSTPDCTASIQIQRAAESLFDNAGGGLTAAQVLGEMQSILENPSVVKIIKNSKLALHIFQNEGLDAARIQNIADINLMAYAFGTEAARGFEYVQFADYLEVYNELATRLENDKKIKNIYSIYDAPLVKTLFKIERAGIVLDRSALGKLSETLHAKLAEIQSQITAQSGGFEANIASPQQLGILLFDKLKIRNPKKYSTDAAVLAQVVDEHPIVPLVLEWRKISKLIGTYTDALPAQVGRDGKIHSTFLQTSTNTGRLSSRDPNLQNIPARGENGAAMRACFVAAPGNKFIIADYSQIQLRLLADIANVAGLKQIFLSGKDIHSMTAHKVFGTPIEQITPDQRRMAKIVNFSISYGVSAFGLARQLGITNSAAQALIDSYFDAFPEIKVYNNQISDFARANAFVETPAGRRVDLPGIRSAASRAYALRAAVNAPIQGAEADLMRLAAIKVDEILAGTPARLVLQVHDELVAEAPIEIADEVAAKIKSVMENIATLSIPLPADVAIDDRLE